MEIERKLYSHLSAPIGAFCHAVRANGFLFLSGFILDGDEGMSFLSVTGPMRYILGDSTLKPYFAIPR